LNIRYSFPVKDDFLIARKQIECFLHSKISKHRFFVGSSTYSLHLVLCSFETGSDQWGDCLP